MFRTTLLLLAVVRLTIALPEKVTQQQCTNDTILADNCITECGVTRPGSDIDHIRFLPRSTGLQKCAEACNTNTKCTTAQYRLDNGYCYLKGRTNAAKADSNVNGVVCTRPPLVGGGAPVR